MDNKFKFSSLQSQQQVSPHPIVKTPVKTDDDSVLFTHTTHHLPPRPKERQSHSQFIVIVVLRFTGYSSAQSRPLWSFLSTTRMISRYVNVRLDKYLCTYMCHTRVYEGSRQGTFCDLCSRGVIGTRGGRGSGTKDCGKGPPKFQGTFLSSKFLTPSFSSSYSVVVVHHGFSFLWSSSFC